MVQSQSQGCLAQTLVWTVFLCLHLLSGVSGCGRWIRQEQSNMRVDNSPWLQSTALDDYVRKPDEHYKYEYISETEGDGFTAYFLNMTSQKWLDETVVNHPIWWHIVTIVVPHTIHYEDATFLWLTGGSNRGGAGVPRLDHGEMLEMIQLAKRSGTVTAVIQQVPNQPLVFQNDPELKSRSEDEIVAWTWDVFESTEAEPEMLIRFPMTKAAVRAMDTVTTFVHSVTGHTIDRFMVSGASKRGHATWTTTAVDNRVVAMAPVVFDMLDFQRNLHHHFRSLGGWSFAFHDYYALNVTMDIDSPRMAALQAAVDPLSYRNRYLMPKIMFSATGDPFFLLDNSFFYFDQLAGPKYLRMVPNAEHSLTGHVTSVLNTMLAFWLSVLDTPLGVPYLLGNQAILPTITWSLERNVTAGKITVTVSRPPSSITVYHAQTTAPGRRDFRLFHIGSQGHPVVNPIMWASSAPTQVGPLTFQAEMENPQDGYYAAFFVEAKFPGPNGSTLEVTTQVNILPDTLPFPQCQGTECIGTLV